MVVHAVLMRAHHKYKCPRMQRARNRGSDAVGGAGYQNDGSRGDIGHAGSIPASTRAAAAKPLALLPGEGWPALPLCA